MTIAEILPDLSKLESDQKWELANRLWEQVEAENDAFPVREDHVAILEERWREYEKDPAATTSWDEIKRKLGKNS